MEASGRMMHLLEADVYAGWNYDDGENKRDHGPVLARVQTAVEAEFQPAWKDFPVPNKVS